MNRRGFIALATAAAVAPQELIAAPEPAPVLDVAAIGSAYTRALAQSLLQTKETIAAAVYQAMIYGRAYTLVDQSGVMKLVKEEQIQKTLAGEVGSRYETILSGWEEAGRASEDPAAESRRVSRLHNLMGLVESSEENFRECG